MGGLADRDLVRFVDDVADTVVDLRRDLHAHPELGHREERTTQTIRRQMRALGWRELPCPTATGAVFALDGGGPGPTTLLRADIDALPVHEEVDLPFRSRVDGVMHACGHDAHTAILLGVAAVLGRCAEAVPGRCVAVFQPAEECLDGCAAMLAGGLLDVVHPDVVFGLHVAARLQGGVVALRHGTAMAMAQPLRIQLRGGGGHAALSGEGGNALLAAAEVATRLGEVVAGMEYEEVPCVCAAGVLSAGTALNVVPRGAVVEGSLRVFDEAQHRTATDRLRRLCAEVAAAHGVTAEVALPTGVPAVVNDPAATEWLRRVATRLLGRHRVTTIPPATPSDDVAELLRRVPGCYFFLGAAPGRGIPPMHHAPDFAIDEGALGTGVLVLAAAVLGATPA